MSIGISGCSRDPKPEMLARAAALGRALAPRGAVVAGRRQLMVASPNLLQEAAAKAASDPHVNCFKMATDGADPVMCAPLRAAGAADASSACLLRPGRPCTIALDSMRRLLLRCCREASALKVNHCHSLYNICHHVEWLVSALVNI